MSWQVPSLRRLFERMSGFARLILFDKRGTGMSDADLACFLAIALVADAERLCAGTWMEPV
jgi:hypothetical protein